MKPVLSDHTWATTPTKVVTGLGGLGSQSQRNMPHAPLSLSLSLFVLPLFSFPPPVPTLPLPFSSLPFPHSLVLNAIQSTSDAFFRHLLANKCLFFFSSAAVSASTTCVYDNYTLLSYNAYHLRTLRSLQVYSINLLSNLPKKCYSGQGASACRDSPSSNSSQLVSGRSWSQHTYRT